MPLKPFSCQKNVVLVVSSRKHHTEYYEIRNEERGQDLCRTRPSTLWGSSPHEAQRWLLFHLSRKELNGQSLGLNTIVVSIVSDLMAVHRT